jgi:uncharacterized protein (TIGR02996 family)
MRPFVQAILDHPSEVGPWSVYADWLLSQGDVRGELMAAALAGRDTSALLAAHAERFLGRFAGELAPAASFRWHAGFWQWAALEGGELPPGREHLPEAVRYLLRHPSAAFLRSLALRFDWTNGEGERDWQPALDALAQAPPSLRELTLEFVGDSEGWNNLGSLSPVWEALPGLETLWVEGATVELGAMDAPRLRRLWMADYGISRRSLQQLGLEDLPSLTFLELGFRPGAPEGWIEASDLRALFAGELPSLRKLELQRCQLVDQVPALLAASPCLPRLRQLVLSGLTARGARALLAHAPRFVHLERIDLEDSALDPGQSAELRAVGLPIYPRDA